VERWGVPPYQHNRKARSATGLQQTGLTLFFGDEEIHKVIAAFCWREFNGVKIIIKSEIYDKIL